MAHPRKTEDHDLLFIPREGKLQRILVDKRPWAQGHPVPSTHTGQIETVEKPSAPDDAGYRKAMSIAAPGGDLTRGPALACMPIRPEPATSYYTCFLVDGNNVNFRNPWTSAQWNDEPDPNDLAEGVDWGEASFEVLLGAGRGRVYHLHVEGGKPQLRQVDLEFEGEIWIQLRSGLVAGRVKYFRHPGGSPKVVPLINVTALNP